MSNARIDILKMVAEGKISPEDGERLLAALKEGGSGRGPESEPDPSSRDPHRSANDSGQSGQRDAEGARGRDGFRSATENLGRAFEDAAGAVRVAAAEGMRAFQKVFDEHRPGTEPVTLDNNTFEVPPGSKLRIHPAVRLSVGGGSAGSSVVVRAIDGDLVRVARGSAVEVHRYDNEYVVTWAKSALEVEIPRSVVSLVARGVGGNVSIYGFPGELRVDALGGTVTVDAPVQPLKISSVGGTVRVTDLGVTSGSSSITATGGDVYVSIAPEASLELRATASFGGGLELPDGSTQVTGRTRHRGTCRFGAGAGRLKVDTVAGWVRVRDPYAAAAHSEDEKSWTGPVGTDPAARGAGSSGSGLPPNPTSRPGPRTSPRDAAGEAMGDAGISAEVFGRSARRPRAGDEVDPEPLGGDAHDVGSDDPRGGSDPDHRRGGEGPS